MSTPIVIAIDGPSGSGKSTCARRLSEALGFKLVETGAMFRTLSWYCQKENIDLGDAKAVTAACRKWKATLVQSDNAVRLVVDGVDPGDALRAGKIADGAAKVATIPKVRDWMKAKQRSCLEFGSLVMEGRDIGTAIFPETDFKFYIDAPLQDRDERRKLEGITEDLAKRDKADSERAAAPLMMGLGAISIKNFGRPVEQTVAEMLSIIESRRTAKPR